MNSELIINRVNNAVKNFGEYQLYDKGLGEITRMDDIILEFISLSPDEAGKILKNIEDTKYGREIISYILITIQDIVSDDWFDDLFLFQPFLSEYY